MKFEPTPGPHALDYVVLGVFLTICMGIGIFYGYRSDKQTTLEAYLFGDRKLLLVPVSLSLFVTFTSAISLMGIPAEIYVFGSMYTYTIIGSMLSILVGAVTIVPLLFPLKLTSAYEYLQLRFRSNGVRTFGTLMGMLQTIVYMGVTLYAPALALQIVAGLPLWLSIAAIGGIGTFYTSIGGIRSVVWTDVFQFIMMIIGIAAILIKGMGLIGDSGVAMDILEAGKRLTFDEYSPDPRVRHTVWGCIIGVTFAMLPNWCNQSSVQRIASLQSLKAARNAFLVSIPIAAVYKLVLVWLGFMIYTYYNQLECDPLDSGILSSMNQLMPYYVFDILRSLPGMSGVYMCCLFSGALSTLSSGINSLAANTVEDILPYFVRPSGRTTMILAAKIAVVCYGAAAICIAYTLRFLSGPVTQMTTSLFGACGGPLAGLFFLGALFPHANWIGALMGGISALAVNIWLVVGAKLYAAPTVRLESNAISGCFPNITTTDSSLLNYTVGQPGIGFNVSVSSDDQVGRASDSSVFPLYSLSYTWYGLIGFTITIAVGMLISCFTGFSRGDPVDRSLIFPFCRKFWGFEVDGKASANEGNQIALISTEVVMDYKAEMTRKRPRCPRHFGKGFNGSRRNKLKVWFPRCDFSIIQNLLLCSTYKSSYSQQNRR